MTNPTLNLQRIYVKDSSFNVADAPQIFREQKPLKNSIEMRINHSPLGEDDHHEVVLSLQVTTTMEEKTAFVSKVEQAGIFKIENVTKEQLEQIASTHCPHLLYPYACNMLSQLAVAGSFPAVVLQPVNFENLYQQSKQKEKEQQEVTSKDQPKKLND